MEASNSRPSDSLFGGTRDSIDDTGSDEAANHHE
jgi:hypothetical protein